MEYLVKHEVDDLGLSSCSVDVFIIVKYQKNFVCMLYVLRFKSTKFIILTLCAMAEHSEME